MVFFCRCQERIYNKEMIPTISCGWFLLSRCCSCCWYPPIRTYGGVRVRVCVCPSSSLLLVIYYVLRSWNDMQRRGKAFACRAFHKTGFSSTIREKKKQKKNHVTYKIAIFFFRWFELRRLSLYCHFVYLSALEMLKSDSPFTIVIENLSSVFGIIWILWRAMFEVCLSSLPSSSPSPSL